MNKELEPKILRLRNGASDLNVNFEVIILNVSKVLMTLLFSTEFESLSTILFKTKCIETNIPKFTLGASGSNISVSHISTKVQLIFEILSLISCPYSIA